jgi:hypothetical protein
MATSIDQQPPTINFTPPDEATDEHPPPAYNGPTTRSTSSDKKRLIAEDKEHKLDSDVDLRSVSSSTSTIAESSDILLPNVAFLPGSSFHIAARGIGPIRFPLPSSELEIDIYNPDGTVAYTSTRSRMSKGDCVLATPEKGDLLSTNYFFGPNKQPIFRELSGAEYSSPVNGTEGPKDEGLFSIKSKWTSRTINLLHHPSNRTFEWSYDKLKTSDGKKANLLVLRLKDNKDATEVKASDSSSNKKGKVLAQLIRSEATRTPGSKSCSAGNGGQLVLDQDAAAVLDEPLIVATCLMMLKKEIDRRRAVQIAVLIGVVNGGA